MPPSIPTPATGWLRLVLLAIAASWLAACDETAPLPGEDSARRERTFPVQALQVAHRDLSRIIQVSGLVEPLRHIELAVQTDGIIVDLHVEEGDRVRAGQVLASIDVREQQAELARARARLDEQQAQYQRLSRLRDGDYVDAATYEAARASLSVAEAEVRLWETRTSFGTLTAPVDATVLQRHADPGEAISRLQPVFTIADLGILVVRLGVSELDVHGIDIDMPVQVSIDALPRDSLLEGRIRRIFPAAQADSRLVTVEVALPGAGILGVRPGYLARARLIVAAHDNVLAVPLNSIAESAETGNYVMVINGDNRLERRRVVPGVSLGGWQEVIDGLTAGERIVAYNPMELNEDAAVRIVGWAG
jgi:membrane fusion protein, multidrug efflux system